MTLPRVCHLGKNLRSFQQEGLSLLEGNVATFKYECAVGQMKREHEISELAQNRTTGKGNSYGSRLRNAIRSAGLPRRIGVFYPRVYLDWSGDVDIVQGFNYFIVSNLPSVSIAENAAALNNYNLTTLQHPVAKSLMRVLGSKELSKYVAISKVCERGLKKSFPWMTESMVTQIYPLLPDWPKPVGRNEEIAANGPTKYLFVSMNFHLKGGKELVAAFERISKERGDLYLTIISRKEDIGKK
jgi:hypothetical protein